MRILYVDIDSLRPDHLGCYGYGRPTSPVVDGIAQQGVRFTNYYVSDSPCVPSRAACFSGRPGIRNGVVAHENTPVGCSMRYGNREREGYAPMLMHHLAAAGYNTVSFSSFANRHLAGWFHFGFMRFNLSSLKNGNEDAHEVNAVALPWFRQHAAEDDWFLHLNYWDPHILYTEPPRYMEEMARYPAPQWPNAETLQRQQSLTGARTPKTLWSLAENNGRSPVCTMPHQIAGREDFEHLIAGYDGAIRYVDEQLGLVLGELEHAGVLEDTAIIVSADHGEAFGELGQYMEHGSTSTAVHRVPLVVKWPGITDSVSGSRRDELLCNTDLAPTVSQALGLVRPAGWYGRSFLPLLGGDRLEEIYDALVLSHGLHTRQRAIYDSRYLYVRTYHPGNYLYPPRMLFDLDIDPHQSKDLAPQRPDLVGEMDEALRAWESENVPAAGLTDPMRDVQEYPPSMFASQRDYLRRLREQNRDHDAGKLLEQWRRVEKDYAPPAL